jgi:hypothetical protein
MQGHAKLGSYTFVYTYLIAFRNAPWGLSPHFYCIIGNRAAAPCLMITSRRGRLPLRSTVMIALGHNTSKPRRSRPPEQQYRP